MSTLSIPTTSPRTKVIAATILAPRSVTLTSAAAPLPGPGQVRVRLDSCGVCGSNIPAWEGREWFSYPLQRGSPGHEGSGTIDLLGEGVDGELLGKRVAALTYNAFATHDIADATSVVPLPSQITGPFPGEAIGCAMNVFARSGVKRGQVVAVVGIGFLGALLTQLAVGAGARVVAISRRSGAREAALRMGASEAIPLDCVEGAANAATEAAAGAFDVAIECAGKQSTLDLASRLVRERGRLVVAGFHQDGPRTVDMQSWNWRGIDVINAHERDPRAYTDGIAAGIEAVVAGRLDPSPLYTHIYPLDRIGEALEAARTRPDGFMKSIVTMEAE